MEFCLQACKVSVKMHGTETDFPQKKKKKKKNCGEKTSGVQKNNNLGSTGFSSALNTSKTVEAHSHAAMACFSRLIVNTAAAVTLAGRLNCEHSRCCYSCRQA